MTTTQNAMILAALKAGRHITQMDALRDFGCFRLAARVNDLRRDGHTIDSARAEMNNGKSVARYTLIKQAGE